MEKTMRELVFDTLVDYGKAVGLDKNGWFDADRAIYNLKDDLESIFPMEYKLEWLADHCDDYYVSSALNKVSYFLSMARSVFDEVETELYDYDKALSEEHKNNNRPVVEEYVNSLTTKAREWLKYDHNMRSVEDMLDYIIEDFNHEDITIDDCKDYFEDMLRDEIKQYGIEKIYVER